MQEIFQGHHTARNVTRSYCKKCYKVILQEELLQGHHYARNISIQEIQAGT